MHRFVILHLADMIFMSFFMCVEDFKVFFAKVSRVMKKSCGEFAPRSSGKNPAILLSSTSFL